MAKINKKNRTIPQRNDPEFVREMKELAKFRWMKNLEKTLPSFADMTKLLRRTDGHKMSVEELKRKPRRENLL